MASILKLLMLHDPRTRTYIRKEKISEIYEVKFRQIFTSFLAVSQIYSKKKASGGF